MQTNTTCYSLRYSDTRTYLWAIAFIIGNIVFPQFCHLFPRGGLIMLPIYFFTLVGAYKYGWRVGLIVAIASPLVNSWLFGMPSTAMLPSILLKSILLALLAGYAASRYHRATLPVLLGVIVAYQLTGGVGEWMLHGDVVYALQDWKIGFPGMLLQLFGGWLCINKLP